MKNSIKLGLYVFCLLFGKLAIAQETHVLTGIVASAKNHLVTAPKGDSWRLQIQWMAEEGTVVEKGDLIVVFDSGSIQAEVEQDEERVVMENLELQQISMRLAQSVEEAQGRLRLAEIMVTKTQIEASIPDGEISAYEKGKHIIAYEKALVEKIKAEENYKRKLEEQKVGIEKQKIQIIKLEENIAYKSKLLERMQVRAEVTGPVSHMMHPHSGEKVAAGMNVQVSWKVLMVQAQSEYQVNTWVHELDAEKFDIEKAKVALSLDAYPGQKYAGKILNMSSQAEQKQDWSKSAYYAMQIGFEQLPEQTIYPGMSVRIEIPTSESNLSKVSYD